MGRPKSSTLYTDSKIILALLFKPRSFDEFEWCLVNEFPFEAPDNAKRKNPEAWKRLKKRHEQSWRIPRKTLARRLKMLVAKGWITRRVLPKHGHHVVYKLDFSKDDEMLKELPVPEPRLTRAQMRLLRKVDVVVPLKEEILGLNDLPDDEVLEIYLRLRAGEFVCPRCLVRGVGKRALDVSMDAEGKFYCRSCGEEVTVEETEKLLSEALGKNFTKRYIESLQEVQRFFQEIDKQLKPKLRHRCVGRK